jgi:dTDP-4-dehydrorhamnose 3,5-epimerase
MIFQQTVVQGAWIVEPEPLEDERGFFARTWDSNEFAAQGFDGRLVQCSVSYNSVRGTLRGLHFQRPPHEEAKLVRCTSGAFFDVAVDLRENSPSFCRWTGVELSAENRVALYIPGGCAHGFLTLTDGVEVLYQISEYWAPDAARGVRWDDPAFSIDWPGDVLVINERDQTYPDFLGNA